MGSGSMGVACEKQNRLFIGIEKDEPIYNVALERCGL
jgi:DNA modification methylase